MWTNSQAQTYLRLAEEMTPNPDATVWTIRLRPGLEFHNGKTVTAEDLIFSINRMVNPKSPGVAANALVRIDAAGIKKIDNRTISVPFAKPYSTFVESLSGVTTVYVVPVGFDPKAPIGTEGLSARRRSSGDARDRVRWSRHDRQRHLRHLVSGLRPRPTPASLRPRAGQVAPQGGRP